MEPLNGFPPAVNGASISIVMAKAPLPHLVKTRLCPPLSAQEAAALHRAFLEDTLAKIEGQAAVFCPREHHGALIGLVPPGCAVVSQSSTGLGKGLIEAVQRAFEAGYRRVVLLDSDSPNLPASYIAEAVFLLQGYDAVLGPCEDGGYYLIGLSAPHLGLFRNIPWSTGQVMQETQAAAVRLGLRTALLPVWYDIDEQEDLYRLAGNLREDPSSAPRTAAFLHSLEWMAA